MGVGQGLPAGCTLGGVDPWEFGGTLRRWRDRVAPDMVAGISVDYLTRLEQGRAAAPSEQVVEALARALRLSDADREHLFDLAGLSVPRLGVVPTRITPSVQRLLDRLAHSPVCVHDAALTFSSPMLPTTR